MTVSEALDIWAEACEKAGAPWYLYRETLLCGACLPDFPTDLACAQTVLFAKDLSAVLSALPKTWLPDWKLFTSGSQPILFRLDGITVLQADVLTAAANREERTALEKTWRKIRRPIAKTLRNHRILSDFFGRKAAGLLASPKEGKLRKTADALMTAAAAAPEQSRFCDSLTDPRSLLLDPSYFGETETVTCGGREYPVFSGWKSWLRTVYGDYENGLSDEIGLGMTLQEKQELAAHQEKCKEALAFLQEVSRDFHLRYYLLAGSVLGPVRHGGFIPWDDDVDVGIRIEDLERFEAVVKAELPKRLPRGFALKQSGPGNPYPRVFSKICYEGRCCVDLWPLVPTYVEGWRAKFTWYFAKLITKVHYCKIGQEVIRFRKLVKAMAAVLSDRQIMALARRNERRYAGKNTPAYINLYSIYHRSEETILRRWLDEPATVNFDGLEVPAVGHTEEYLTHLYGDYMAKPAPWKRASYHVERF